MAKIRKAASHGENIRQPPTCPGEHVSTDIKNVTTTSIGGYRYCVVFVDLYSGDKYVAHLKDIRRTMVRIIFKLLLIAIMLWMRLVVVL